MSLLDERINQRRSIGWTRQRPPKFLIAEEEKLPVRVVEFRSDVRLYREGRAIDPPKTKNQD
jgi:hypothetical protein